MVEDLIGRSRELSHFELGNQLLARNRKGALELCIIFWKGAEPVMLIGVIASNFHRLALRGRADRGSR